MVDDIAIVRRSTLKAVASGGAGGAKAGSGREGNRAFWYADGPCATLLLKDSRNGVLCGSTSAAANEAKVACIDSGAVKDDVRTILAANVHIITRVGASCVVGGAAADNRHIGVARVKEELGILVGG